jgi:hypothetical protein
MTYLRQHARQENVPETIFLLQPSTFLHYQVEVTGHVAFSSPVGRDPEIRDLLRVKTRIFTTEG